MKKIFAASLLAFAFSALQADAISIDMNEFRKLTYPTKVIPAKDTIVELTPIRSGQSVQPVQPTQSLSEAGADKYQKKNKTGNAKEDTRDELLRELRGALETGKDFKYYFPNFDYAAFKKDVEAMMRDVVSQ